ncbi:hypothetical protein B9Z55_027973 [Caenorhabditis nigoni]|uniref:Uncharacterized protein n=1 Tax=Caenorhabditis nigoni TaxID=1611254 RepID=A0A2G5SDK2_9PELO|nr:hypothetical protein B9Z55_027973 [Caenorhabditis nigoni]
MAALILSWDEKKSQAARGTDSACHIEAISATVSGISEEVASFRVQLEEKKILAKVVNRKLEEQFHSTSHSCYQR